MDEKAEAGFAPPLHPGVMFGLRFDGRGCRAGGQDDHRHHDRK
jgi:hypothetical protein